MKCDIAIGLEIHAELSTASKMFCGCTTAFGGAANTHCCPICVGMPGTLPAVNGKAVKHAVRAGLALGCSISLFSKMDRKNYFYPDLPKGYQTSQYDLPLCQNGAVEIGEKTVRIRRIHLEEDAGKLYHDDGGGPTRIDYNRGGIPLIEIVTEPDMENSGEARAFVEKVRAVLQFLGVSDCRMQEGSLRVDVNLSVRPAGQRELGIRTEIKNLNSFRFMERAIREESERQMGILKRGGIVARETRRWDEEQGKSFSMRKKEEAHDYRYFPDPDLRPLVLDAGWVEALRETLPELPHQRRVRYIEQWGLPEYDADLLTSTLALSEFFEAGVRQGIAPKMLSNWIMGDVMRILNERDTEEIPLNPESVARLLRLVEKGTINQNTAKKVLILMADSEKSPEEIILEEGLQAMADDSLIRKVVENVLRNHPGTIAEYLSGKTKAFGFLMGQVMKETGGRADPGTARSILEEKLQQARNCL